jgi:hypothetical protein
MASQLHAPVDAIDNLLVELEKAVAVIDVEDISFFAAELKQLYVQGKKELFDKVLDEVCEALQLYDYVTSSQMRNIMLKYLPRLPPPLLQSQKYDKCLIEGEGEEEECSICLENFHQDELVCDIPCKHLFHEQCLAKWFEKTAISVFICPLCKQNVQ